MIRIARAIGATAAAATLLIGLPTFLIMAVGWPLPTAIPTLDEIDHAIQVGIDERIIMQGLALLGWLAWAHIAIAVLVEATAAARGRVAPRIPLLPQVVQTAVRRLVAGVTLTAGISIATSGGQFRRSGRYTVPTPRLTNTVVLSR
jgi:hypothetical protein